MLTLLTPTRFRPKSFNLLQRWMERQTGGWDQWVVVCDGGIDDYDFRCGQHVIARNPVDDRLPSLNENLLAGLRLARGDQILIIEDDDYYRADYTQRMRDWLGDAPLVGVAPAMYYHVQSRAYALLPNKVHCSLACTGFRREVIPELERVIRIGDPFIDFIFWVHWWQTLERPAFIAENDGIQVGMKGMPGVKGYGAWHYAADGNWKPDDGSTLTRWIGYQDAQAYKPFATFDEEMFIDDIKRDYDDKGKTRRI